MSVERMCFKGVKELNKMLRDPSGRQCFRTTAQRRPLLTALKHDAPELLEKETPPLRQR
jgi:hypothetical protein